MSELLEQFDMVLCVDDGSTDDEARLHAQAGAVVSAAPRQPWTGAALRTGFEFAQRHLDDVSHVVTFDADGQHDARDARAMVDRARPQTCDVVLGLRATRRPEGQPRVRRLVLAVALRLSRLTSGLDLTDTHNGLRVINRRALGVFVLRQRGMAYASELEALIPRNGLSWAEHPVAVTYTEYSRSKGQRNLNAFNIMYDLVTARFLAP